MSRSCSARVASYQANDPPIERLQTRIGGVPGHVSRPGVGATLRLQRCIRAYQSQLSSPSLGFHIQRCSDTCPRSHSPSRLVVTLPLSAPEYYTAVLSCLRPLHRYCQVSNISKFLNLPNATSCLRRPLLISHSPLTFRHVFLLLL